MDGNGQPLTNQLATRCGRDDEPMSDQEDSRGDNHAVLQPLLKGVGLHGELEQDKTTAKRIALFFNVSLPSHLAKWLEHQGTIVYTLHKFGTFGVPRTALMIAKKLIREGRVMWLHGRVAPQHWSNPTWITQCC